MKNNDLFKDYKSYVSLPANRYGKTTLFEDDQVLVGLNCFLSGQEMEKHAHANQHRFYLVMEGCGHVWVGENHQEVISGMSIRIPCGCAHRIVNDGTDPLIMLVWITPVRD